MNKDIFGRPGEGIHRHVGGFALADLIMTVIAALLISYFSSVSSCTAVLALLVLGQILHFLFDVDTVWTLHLKRLFNLKN